MKLFNHTDKDSTEVPSDVALKARKKRLLRRCCVAVCAVLVLAVSIGFIYQWNRPADAIITDNMVPLVSAVPGTVDRNGFYVLDFSMNDVATSARSSKVSETASVINDAITKAVEEGYTKLRLMPGSYWFANTWSNVFAAPSDGICVPSDVTLNLQDTKLYMAANASPCYSLISISMANNVHIMGGELIGDKKSHSYSRNVSIPTHEFGMGVAIFSSSNVTIENMKIHDMTGDGVIAYRWPEVWDCDRVTIRNNTIYNCRRQGISLVSGTNSLITGNTIHSIKGTDPQYGIDIEIETGYSVDGSVISHNNISQCSGGSISAHSGNNYRIENNNLSGLVIAVKCTNVVFYNNTLNSTILRVYPTAENITAESADQVMKGFNSKVQVLK